MWHRITKCNTFQPNIFACDWSLRKSFGEVLWKSQLLVIWMWGDIELEEWTVSTLFKDVKVSVFKLQKNTFEFLNYLVGN
jgi:hypothetical protein